ncbi:baculoviral IAP repeat-containing protein 6-like [Schistocerca gregaria]|uniref:baculoviral IAP repeat-containing protein 6-like n=1 Tax=Schistocerca gregaria TaxID=7010 RepID=UPI00211DB3F3|nr:baculoviral IAP repeat-containing protein 6-like [Schistocerca gregaria]
MAALSTESVKIEAMEEHQEMLTMKKILHEEYVRWSEANSGHIKLVSQIVNDGQICLEFSVGNSGTFTLVCPSDYPNHEDSFFIERSTLHGTWCVALNEYIVDSDCCPSLKTVLDKALRLYLKDEQSSMCSSSDDSAEDEEIPMEEDESYDADIIIEEKKKRWRKKEASLRAVDNNPKASDMFQNTSKDHPEQVFSSSAASGILTNDLVNIMMSAKRSGIAAEPVDDNIYQWYVYLSSFTPGGPLAQDLNQIKEHFGYKYIQLQLDFTMDLYPFYPPVVKVIRPRLVGSTINSVATLDLLKLSNWNPARDMKSVLEEIKDYLDKNSRLNIKTKRNDRLRFPQGAYLDIENHLMRLTFVSEVPLANTKAADSSGWTAKVPCTSESEIPVVAGKKKDYKKTWFPRGTGYSSSTQSGWDVKAYLAAQKEKDHQIELVLRGILREIEKVCGISKGRSSFLVYNSVSFPTSSSFAKFETSGTEVGGSSAAVGSAIANNETPCGDIEMPLENLSESENVELSEVSSDDEKWAIDGVEELCSVLADSSLLPFLESKLKVTSFLDICQHTSVYQRVVDIINTIATQPKLVPLLWHLPGRANSMYDLISQLEKEAESIVSKLKKTAENGTAGNLKKFERGRGRKCTLFNDWAGHDLSLGMYEPQLSGRTDSDDEIFSESKKPINEHTFANEFCRMSQAVKEALQNCGLLDKSASTSEEGETSEGRRIGINTLDVARAYKDALKDLQFLSCDIDVEGPRAHLFSSQFKKALPPSSQQVMRIAQEVGALSTSLPLDIGSAIFVRTDDARFTMLKALITGPEGTPYSGGCFIFDIFLPMQYPHVPPMVKLCTTGGGTVRFNPNLYACGRVCLSLLGTWHGLQGEAWLPTSTLLQVLVSIQSLILVPEPFFNEPGFESMINTPKGKTESANYNYGLMVNTIKYAMLEQIRHPAHGFEEVIRRHFILKKNRILKELKEYIRKQRSGKEITEAYCLLKKELEKLIRSAKSSE